jgi:hypothetical protein
MSLLMLPVKVTIAVMADSSSADGLDHSSLQPLAIALISLLPALATVSLALMAYSRTLTRTFGADDVVTGSAGVGFDHTQFY